jgi:hypothetical protein
MVTSKLKAVIPSTEGNTSRLNRAALVCPALRVVPVKFQLNCMNRVQFAGLQLEADIERVRLWFPVFSM